MYHITRFLPMQSRRCRLCFTQSLTKITTIKWFKWAIVLCSTTDRMMSFHINNISDNIWTSQGCLDLRLDLQLSQKNDQDGLNHNTAGQTQLSALFRLYWNGASVTFRQRGTTFGDFADVLSHPSLSFSRKQRPLTWLLNENYIRAWHCRCATVVV